MTKARKGFAVLAAATLITSLGATAPAVAAGSETLKVDFSQTTGDFRGGATGTLYGFGDHGAPTQALINGAHITNTSQKPPFGTQHPSGDALKVEEGFFDKHGQEMYVYTQDYYPDWSYHGGVRPGDTRTYDQATGSYTDGGNGVWDYLEVIEFVAEAIATGSKNPDGYVFIPFNEPDGGNWYADWGRLKDTFLDDWKASYDKIQAVWARHGLGHARIGGPGDAIWRQSRSADILTFAKANNVIPDIFIWHELGIDNLATFRSHFEEYRALEASLGIDPLPINITEFGMLRDMGTPGQLIQWLAMFEDMKVDAQTAYWNYAGNFSDNSARTNGANAGWWMFKWYGDLEGSKTVKFTPPYLNSADTLQGIGAIDSDNQRATVLYGGTDADVALDLAGIPESFGTQVDVEVREATLSGAEGISGTPPVIVAMNNASISDGELSLTIPSYDRYAAYQVIVTPSQERTIVTDAVWSTSIEAEQTALTGARVYTQDPLGGGGWRFLASGSKDVGSFNQASSKSDWTVSVPRDGTYRYQVIGATPGTPGRHALFIDGELNQTVQYTADLALTDTHRWMYRGSAEVEVALTAGQHTLSLRSSENGTTVLPNSDITLDKFVLTDITDGEPTTYPASTLRYSGGASVNYDSSMTAGYGLIQGAAQRADVYAHAWDSGYYDVAIDYRTTSAATLELTVNGRVVTTLEVPGVGDWTSTARLHLSEGINEIDIRSVEGILLKELTTTRAPDGDKSAITIEAESGTMRGAAVVESIGASTGTNVSGGSIAGYLGNGAANFVEIPRHAGFDTPGDYDVVVTYANAELSGRHDYNPQVVDRRLQVREAGSPQVVGSAYFRYTYSWNSFWDRTIPVTLTTSDGALQLGNDGAFAPNVDKIKVAPVLLGVPTTVANAQEEANIQLSFDPASPDGTNGWYISEVAVSATSTASASTDLEYSINAGAWIPYSNAVSVSADGTHTFAVRAIGDTRALPEPVVATIKLDRSPPSVTAVKDSNTSEITLTGADPVSGLASIEYRLGTESTWRNYAMPFKTDSATTVTFRALDKAGNRSGEQTVDVIDLPTDTGKVPGVGQGIATTGYNLAAAVLIALALVAAGAHLFRRTALSNRSDAT